MNLYQIAASCETVISLVLPSGIIGHGSDNKLQTVHAVASKIIFLYFCSLKLPWIQLHTQRNVPVPLWNNALRVS